MRNKQKKQETSQSGDMSHHVTSVDGFQDLRSTSPRVCPPDPGHGVSHSIQSEISGRKNTLSNYIVFLVPHSQQEGRNMSQQEKACDKVSSSKSFLVTRLSCVLQARGWRPEWMRFWRHREAFQVHDNLPGTRWDAKSESKTESGRPKRETETEKDIMLLKPAESKQG